MRAAEIPHGSEVALRLPNWLGDVLLCTPALAALAEARPDLRLTALVRPGLTEAVRTLPGISEVFPLEKASAVGLWRQGRQLRARGFAAALVFPKGFREALLVRLAGIPLRVGLSTDRRSCLLSHAVPFTEEEWRRHHALQFGQVLSPLGLSMAEKTTSFPLEVADRTEAERVLSEAGVKASFAAFHIAASKAPRAWHAERFGEVAAGLYREVGLTPVLLGTPGEADCHAAFRTVCPEAVDLAGKTSLRGMAALLERATLFVGNDSGPMHLAAAVGTPVVAVFGPGAPQKTLPWAPPERVRTLYAGLPCSPCRQAFWQECSPAPSGKPACLEAVGVESVLAAGLELVRNPAT